MCTSTFILYMILAQLSYTILVLLLKKGGGKRDSRRTAVHKRERGDLGKGFFFRTWNGNKNCFIRFIRILLYYSRRRQGAISGAHKGKIKRERGGATLGLSLGST